MTSDLSSRGKLVNHLQKHLERLCPREPVLAVEDEERHPLNAEAGRELLVLLAAVLEFPLSKKVRAASGSRPTQATTSSRSKGSFRFFPSAKCALKRVMLVP